MKKSKRKSNNKRNLKDRRRAMPKEKELKEGPMGELQESPEDKPKESLKTGQKDKLEPKDSSKEKPEDKPKDKKRNTKRVLLFVHIGLFCILTLSYLIISNYYQNHFYNNTLINGQSVSNMTRIQAEDIINVAQRGAYRLELQERNGLIEQIPGEDIDLSAVFDDSLAKLLEQQNGFEWPVYLMQSRTFNVNTTVTYNEILLNEKINELECLDKSNMVEPVNAYISSYGDNGYEIIPEEPGTKIKKDVLQDAIKKSIGSLESSIILEKEGCYEEAKIKSEYKKLIKAYEKMKKLTTAKIIYEFGDVTEIVDGKRISEWISMNEDYQVIFNTDGIKDFVDYIGRTYNSFGMDRTFKTSYGSKVKINGGDYGWWLNRETEVFELTDMIIDGRHMVKEPAYFQKAGQHGENDVGDTYVEINLETQHLFFYKEGKLIVETDLVTGNLSKNRGTPKGTFSVKYKEKNAVLNGADYSVPVDYWMPFNGNIGMHDASWRKSFGKDIYLKNGSHGCINLPTGAAGKIFEHIEKGVAVVVY